MNGFVEWYVASKLDPTIPPTFKRPESTWRYYARSAEQLEMVRRMFPEPEPPRVVNVEWWDESMAKAKAQPVVYGGAAKGGMSWGAIEGALARQVRATHPEIEADMRNRCYAPQAIFGGAGYGGKAAESELVMQMENERAMEFYGAPAYVPWTARFICVDECKQWSQKELDELVEYTRKVCGRMAEKAMFGEDEPKQGHH